MSLHKSNPGKTAAKTEGEKMKAALLSTLQEITRGPGVATSDVNIVHRGTKIVLPGEPHPMEPREAIEHLERLDEAMNTEVSVREEIRAFPLDGAVALMKAMQEKFGWATPRPTMGFFGPNPPQMVTVETSTNPADSIQVLWGKFELPGIEGDLQCGADMTADKEFIFVIHGTVLKREAGLIRELAELTRQFVVAESIYKGKAIRVRTDGNGVLTADAPSFIHTTRKDPLILPKLTEAALQANVFAPVERASECRKAGIPLKRGVILAGPPGTGKTLASQELADKAIKSGWTFILLPDTRGLASVIHFARRYAPCVVFCEDIDCGPASEQRGFKLNDLLNTIDGIQTKDAEVMLCFTTNDVKKIDRTLVRPGRIDAIIEFPKPQDTETIERFLRHYGNGRIAINTSLTKSCQLLEGQLPAIIREAVERSKLYALARGVNADDINLVDDDIEAAIVTMKAHMDFFHSKKEIQPSPEEQVGIAMRNLLETSASNMITSGKLDKRLTIMMDAMRVPQG
jgi:transitional endoplasmic reticulum ATPase